HAIDVAREVARRRIDFAAREAAAARFFRRLGHPCAFGEYPRGRIVDDAVDAFDVADHVVVEHRFDAPAALLRVLGEYLAAEQALFLPGERGVDDRRVESIFRQHARGFERARKTGRIVVRARRVVGLVHDIGDAGVDVAAHDHVAVRIARAALDGDHAHHFYGIRNALFTGNRAADV